MQNTEFYFRPSLPSKLTRKRVIYEDAPDHKGTAITNVFTFTHVCVCVFSSRRSVSLGVFPSTHSRAVNYRRTGEACTHALTSLLSLIALSEPESCTTPAGRPRRDTEVVLVIFCYTSNGS